MVERWYECPVCGHKLIKIRPTSIMRDVPVYCRQRTCKFATYPMVYMGRVLDTDEPFPMIESE